MLEIQCENCGELNQLNDRLRHQTVRCFICNGIIQKGQKIENPPPLPKKKIDFNRKRNYKKLLKSIKSNFSKQVIYVLIIFIIGFIGLCDWEDKEDKEYKGHVKIITGTAPQKKIIKLNAWGMKRALNKFNRQRREIKLQKYNSINEYQLNQIEKEIEKINKKTHNYILNVYAKNWSGKIHRIDGGGLVWVDTEAGLFVAFRINDNDITRKVANWREGDKIRLSGKIKGSFTGYSYFYGPGFSSYKTIYKIDVDKIN